MARNLHAAATQEQPARSELRVMAPEDGAPRYVNRELSWLEFNDRVLDLADDDGVPLLERVKFLAIFSTNLDEFFQVRVAGLKDQVAAGLPVTDPAGLSPAEQLARIRRRVQDQLRRVEHVFLDDIVPALADAGVSLHAWDDLDAADRKHLVDVFESRIFPVLTPLAVDPGHPFPHISDLSLNLAVLVRDPLSSQRRFARVKVPPLLPRFIAMPGGSRLVALEQVISPHLPRLFPGMQIDGCFPFRVTRNADLTVEEEEADDLLAAVEMELRRRRFRKAVRLEVDATATPEVRDLLQRELELGDDDVYPLAGPLDLGGLWSLHDLDRPDLKDEPWVPITQARLAGDPGGSVDVFAVLREGDVLVHHPYASFTTSVEAFIKQAAADPDVLTIKQTLYRTSGDSPIVKALIRAAERGKQVAVLVELKARFDEQANIAWARALEDAGVHVVYGIVGLKTHSKTALVVRQEEEGIRRYCHIGTGNYNPRTARLYEDLGLLTADPDVGADLTDLFNYLTGYSRQRAYRKLLVAPLALRQRVLELIAEQAALGADGRIVLKMNGIDDPAVIDALYEAAGRGVAVDLIVRSICCLRPGVPGLSETIRVRSIVGRFLEHSRIFAFGGGDGGPVRYFIGSADLRSRNLDRRIEVMAPVDDPALQVRLAEVLDANLGDDATAWELGPSGRWERRRGDGPSTHRRLQHLAVGRARRWSDGEPLQPDRS